MVNEGYSTNQIIELSGACSSAVARWKKEYSAELEGNIQPKKMPLDPLERRIQELEKQLKSAQKDNEILKKAVAFFNISLSFFADFSCFSSS